MGDVEIPDEAQEAALAALIDVRDASPRVYDDADSYDVTMACLRAAAPLLLAAHLEQLAGTPAADGPWWALETALRTEAARLRTPAASPTQDGDAHVQ